MPSKRNIELLENLKEKVDRASAIFFVDYQGLTHQMLEEMRGTLSELDAEVTVIKNTLTNLALQEKKVDASDKLKGPMALLFCYGDPVAPAKALVDFAKKNELPEIKFGYFEGALVEDAQVKELATVPPQEILLGKLVGGLQAPISGLVYSLNFPIQRLAMVMNAVAQGKN